MDSGFFGTVNLCFLYPPSVAGGYYELIGDCAPATTTTTTTAAETTTTTTTAAASLDWDCILGTCTNVGTGAGIYTSYEECIAYGCETPPTTTTTTAAATTTTTTTTAAPSGTFTVKNTSGSGVISDVYGPGGIYFYVTTAGSFPISTGQQVDAGGASRTGDDIIVEISSYSSTSCLSLYINGGLSGQLEVSGNGTYTFTNKTFTSSDDVLIEYVSGFCA